METPQTGDRIRRAAAFLAGEDADYITGVVMPVDSDFRFHGYAPTK